MSAPTIVWFRRDLRLSDQAAVAAAAENGPIIPVYILDDETPKHRKMGAASHWWLHHSIKSLSENLEKKGSRLVLRQGDSASILADIVRKSGACEIHALRHYEPWWLNAESHLQGVLDGDCKLVLHDGNYLVPPGSVTTGSGDPYKIFTPFWKSLKEKMPPPEPEPVLQTFHQPEEWPASDDLESFDLLPTKPDWAKSFAEMWSPGEEGAKANLRAFASKAKAYDEGRNLPSEHQTSRLSPHLHFGEISPSAVWHGVTGKDPSSYKSVETFLSEIGWRDYAQNVIMQFPQYGGESYREKMRGLPWRDFRSSTVRDEFDAWTKGRTGYPIVDAGMRELWSTGWMHNRVRMIAASFLIKHLLIDWREGEQWFWDTLVDADYGSNSTNWQWVAGTGVDSNMFVRIMAPLSQSDKFNAGDYIRKWVPELSHIKGQGIHDPEEYDCKPDDYPAKIIAHKDGRERALNAYKEVK